MTGGAPLSYMRGAGSRNAEALETLAWGFSAISIAVVCIIALLIVLAIRRSRAMASTDPFADVGRHGKGLALIWWGLGLSLPVLVVMAIWNFLTTRSLATVPENTGPVVEVTGHRWWWEVRYEGGPDRAVSDANQLVIPVGVPVRLKLKSGDVIHDFWVPKLGPKMDMVPGRTNQTWLEADKPGLYFGQCAEFCGMEHAHMAFIVRAVPADKFAAWLAHQQQPAAWLAHQQQPAVGTGTVSDITASSDARSDASLRVPDAPSAPEPRLSDRRAETQHLFEEKCGVCHAIRGTDAGGILGPDLTHFASRPTIAAGMLANTPAQLDRWLAAPQALKPGSLMPQVQLTAVERAQLVRYLESLS